MLKIQLGPVDRITLVIEKQKRHKEAFEILNWYKEYDDYLEILAAPPKTIDERYERLRKKLQ